MVHCSTRIRKRTTASRAVLAGLVGASVLLVSACGGGTPGGSAVEAGPPAMIDDGAWQEVVTAAREEGTVNLYFSLGGMEAVVEDFKEAYPEIDVESNFASTGDLVQRLDQEMDSGVSGADVVMHAAPEWFAAKSDSDQLAALSVSPENTDFWDDELEEQSFATVFGFPYTLTSQGDSTVYTNLEELLDEDPDAKVAINDPSVAVAVAYYYESQRQEFGDEILDKLAAAQYSVFPGNTQMAQAIANGSFDYAVPGHSGTTKDLIAKGADLTETVPDQAANGAYYNVAVPTTAAHSNAGAVFINWLMSESGSQSFADNFSPASVPHDQDGTLPWGEMDSYDPEEWTTEKWNAWIAEYWTPRFG